MLGVFVAPGARAQLVIERTVNVGQTIADRGQYVSTILWSDVGLSSISRATVALSFANADATRPMVLGQFFGSLTYGTASEEERTAQLFSPTNALSGLTPTYTVESALDGARLASDAWSLLVADQLKGGGSAVWNSWKLTVEGAAANSGTFRPGANGRLAVSAGESTAQVGAAVEVEAGSSVAAEAAAGRTLRLEGGLTGAGDLDTTTESGGKVVVGGNSADFSGILKVAGSGTTELTDSRALGTGQLRQTNGNSTVRLNFAGTLSNAVSVYKVAFGTNGATLAGTTTVNNAEFDVASGDTNTITGQITGGGGVTKTGLGTLVLGGTTTNNFTGASAVNAGTLFLNKTSGTTAISGSSIAVNSGGTLLLGAANQISDTTLVTLAGGTLDTGGYGDAVGKLTVTAASTIKGLAAAGGGSDFTFSDIDLGTYAGGGGSALTFLNSGGTTYGLGTTFRLSTANYTLWSGYDEASFNSFTSKISFNDESLRASISFSGGYTSLTVAAIPEPRVYAAAAVLTMLIGYAEYRRRRRRIEDRS